VEQTCSLHLTKGFVLAGSPRWMAPEVLRGSDFNATSDVYSFAVILWELTTLQTPWEECVHPYQLVHFVVEQGLRPPMPSSCEPPTTVFADVCALIQVRR
jgi:serine/threonine protein kinase